jgi:hypothetical protein
MLNRALRLMYVDAIIKMGFFIVDLHRHIEKISEEQFNKYSVGEIFILYRGQGLFKTDFNQLSKKIVILCLSTTFYSPVRIKMFLFV